MAVEIERDLKKCEQSLFEMQKQYPGLARKAAESRYVYDVAWAEAINKINHQAIIDGVKPPTVAVMESGAVEMVKGEMETARLAEADLDAAKKHIDTLQGILSSVQTRSKLLLMEMSLK